MTDHCARFWDTDIFGERPTTVIVPPSLYHSTVDMLTGGETVKETQHIQVSRNPRDRTLGVTLKQTSLRVCVGTHVTVGTAGGGCTMPREAAREFFGAILEELDRQDKADRALDRLAKRLYQAEGVRPYSWKELSAHTRDVYRARARRFQEYKD